MELIDREVRWRLASSPSVQLFQLNFNLFDHRIFGGGGIFLVKGKSSHSRIFLSGFRGLADLSDF